MDDPAGFKVPKPLFIDRSQVWEFVAPEMIQRRRSLEAVVTQRCEFYALDQSGILHASEVSAKDPRGVKSAASVNIPRRCVSLNELTSVKFPWLKTNSLICHQSVPKDQSNTSKEVKISRRLLSKDLPMKPVFHMNFVIRFEGPKSLRQPQTTQLVLEKERFSLKCTTQFDFMRKRVAIEPKKSKTIFGQIHATPEMK